MDSIKTMRIDDNDDSKSWRQRRGTGFSFSGEAGNDRLLMAKTMKTFNAELSQRSGAGIHEIVESGILSEERSSSSLKTDD